MTKESARNIKDQIAKIRQVINHEAVGLGILQKKLKRRQTKLKKLIHFNR